jgi:hypothetical protein
VRDDRVYDLLSLVLRQTSLLHDELHKFVHRSLSFAFETFCSYSTASQALSRDLLIRRKTEVRTTAPPIATRTV